MIPYNVMEAIEKLPREKLFLLGLCYTERNRIIIEEFDKLYGEHISEQFNSKLEYAYSTLLVKSLDQDVVRGYSEVLEQMLPDSEDYTETLGGLALNGLSMLCYCYRFLLTAQSENIGYIIGLALETVDAIGQEHSNDYDYETGHMEEYVVMDKYLSILTNISDISSTNIATLRDVSLNNMFVIKDSAILLP